MDLLELLEPGQWALLCVAVSAMAGWYICTWFWGQPQEIPRAVMKPVVTRRKKANPVHVRVVERMKVALEHGDVASTYRQQARMASNGWAVCKTIADCDRVLAELKGEQA